MKSKYLSRTLVSITMVSLLLSSSVASAGTWYYNKTINSIRVQNDCLIMYIDGQSENFRLCVGNFTEADIDDVLLFKSVALTAFTTGLKVDLYVWSDLSGYKLISKLDINSP